MPRDRTSCWTLVTLLALLPSHPAVAGRPEDGPAHPTPAGVRDARSTAARIDELVGARLDAAKVRPAPVADDAEFFRRLNLDLNGRIPSVAQLSDFLDDDRPDKRSIWIEELMAGRDTAALYTRHFTNVWRRTLLRSTPAQPAVAGSLEGWLAPRVEANVPYDVLVRELLTDPGADAFFVANGRMPVSLAARTSRLFLGVRLECVQCHDDRSGGDWKRPQFWELAAFFTRSEEDGPAGGVRPGRGADPARIKLGDTGSWVEGRFLDGTRPDWSRGGPRALLAAWTTGRQNPWFAKAAVNRVWHIFFGTGLIDPVDGLGDASRAPSHPELLDELSKQFVDHDYDLRFLIRAITASRTYQRTSRQTSAGQEDRRLFARAQVRGLGPEQLFDSLAVATGSPLGQVPGSEPAGRSEGPQARFLAEFEDVHESPAEAASTILQALMMINGTLIDEATRPENSATLAACGAPAKPATQAIEELYMAALSRRPRDEERARLVEYVASGDRQQALRDVLWALLNSTEFVVNH